jgi:hypothetical protein
MSTPPPPVVPSPRFSFAGYSFMAWVTKNAEWIKGFLAAETAALGAQQWKLAAALALGAVSKWAYDAVDYFVSVN